MKKQWSAAFLLAGTAIGSGMLSLPLVLAKFGLGFTFLWMLFFAALTYLTALIRSDLNLNTFASATFKDIGQALHCSPLGRLGNLLIKLLHFALMAAYLAGFASILGSLITDVLGLSLPTWAPRALILASALGFALLLFFASKALVAINKILFLALFGTFLFLVAVLLLSTPLHVFPAKAVTIAWGDWATLVPIVFTSFGFQGSIASMTKFCQNDRTMIRKACLWGSLIPAFVYCLWTGAILLIVANADSGFFQKLIQGESVALGALIGVLSNAAEAFHIQAIVWAVSLFALLTSILGVGLALLDIFQEEHPAAKIPGASKALIVSALTFLPAFTALFWKNAFLAILNVSGILLALIAIIVPCLMARRLFCQGSVKVPPLLKSSLLLRGVLICGLGIISLGILELFW